jgi:inner membrane protein
MDSLTQAALGACVGYAVAGREMGRKALWWGVLAGTLPDLDIVPLLPFNNEFTYLKHHRGFSHSILFCILGAPLAATLAAKINKMRERRSKSTDTNTVGFRPFFDIFFWGFATHIFLDCFTTWGTQVFWPHPYRVAWNSIFIIDPFYTVPLLVGIVACLVSYRHTQLRISRNGFKWIYSVLILSSVYLGLSLGAKLAIDSKFDQIYAENGITTIRKTTRPTPFNILLWTSTAETENGYYYSMASLFDALPDTRIIFTPKNHQLASNFSDKRSQELISYTKGFYSVENVSEEITSNNPLSSTSPSSSILIHDLRYGFLGDPWLNGLNYVFSYKLTKHGPSHVALETLSPRPRNISAILKQIWRRIWFSEYAKAP